MLTDFLFAAPYETRCVARYDADWGFVSTAAVNDADRPYETAVMHPEYNDGKIVIVEAYDTRGEAQAGHEQWVTTMTTDPLPASLTDRGEAAIAQLVDAFSPGDDWRVRPRQPK